MKRIVSEETRKRIGEGIKAACDKKGRPIHEYDCEKCGEHFVHYEKIYRGRKHCEKCRRKVPKKKDPESILEISPRTIGKIFERMDVGCSRCGWNEAICDIHHIIPFSEGGPDTHENLTLLCPNCHRLAHKKKIHEFTNLIDHIGDDWKKFYGI